MGKYEPAKSDVEGRKRMREEKNNTRRWLKRATRAVVAALPPFAGCYWLLLLQSL